MQFSVFQQTSSSRSHGYASADYKRYAIHCAASIARLRKNLKLQQRSGSGKKSLYERKETKDVKSLDSRHLSLILVEAERCWSAAQDAKSAYSRHLANGEAAAHDRRRIINKLNRACLHSKALVEAVRKLSLQPLQEAEAVAYRLFLLSNYYFEKGAWHSAITSLNAAQSVLEPLAAKTGVQTSEAIAYELLDEIQPMIRVATAKGESTQASTEKSSTESKATQDLVQPLLQELKSTESQSSKVKHLTEVTWWNAETIPLRNADLARAVSSALQTADKDIVAATDSLKRFDKSFNALSEAEDVARKIVDENQIALQRAHSSRFEAASRPLTQAHEYLLYRLLLTKIRRDLHLVQNTSSRLHTKKNPQKGKSATLRKDDSSSCSNRRKAKIWAIIIKLYDGVLQSYEQMRELGIVEAEGDLSEMVDSRILVTRAERAHYLALVYGLLQSFDKALILNEHASLFLRQAAGGVTIDSNFDQSSLELPSCTSPQIKQLEADLAQQHDRLSKDWFVSVPAEAGDEVGLSKLSLESGSNNKKGPLVFDISFNYAQATDMDAIAARGQELGTVPTEQQAAPAALKDVTEKVSPAAAAATPGKSRLFSWFGRG